MKFMEKLSYIVSRDQLVNKLTARCLTYRTTALTSCRWEN